MDWRERDELGAVHRPQLGTRGLTLAQQVGQLQDRRRVEQRADWQVSAQLAADPADQAHGQQRMSAQVEEVVVHADLPHTEDVGEQRAQHPLALGARRAPSGAGTEVGGGQGRAVELAVGGQRNRWDRHEDRGHHVFGQAGPGVLAEVGGPPGAQHGVGDDPPVTGHDHHCALHCRVLGEHVFDLAEFHAVTADLDLAVRATDELQQPTRGPPDQVAGAVQARTGGGGHEPGRGQPGPPQVTARQSGTAHVQLADHADRHRAQPCVVHVHGVARDRPADRHRTYRYGRARLDAVLGAVHGGLGGAVRVDHGDVRVRAAPVRQRLAAQRFTAQHEFRGGRAAVVQHRQVARGGLEQGPALAGGLQPGHAHAAAADQWRVEGGHGEVEGDRGVHGRGSARARVGPAGLLQVGDHGALLHQHALGRPGRTRGVDQVRRAPRVPRHHRVRVLLGKFRLVDQQPGDPGVGNPRGASGVGEQEGGSAVGEQELGARGRVVQVQGDVARAGLEHRQQRDHQVGVVRQGNGHQVLGPDAQADQLVRQAVRPPVQLLVGQLVQHRHGVRRAFHLPLEQVGDRVRRARVRGCAAQLGQLAAFLRRQVVDPAHRLPGVLGEAGQQCVQVLDQSVHLLAGKQVGAETDPQPEFVARQHHQAQRVVVGVAVGHAGDAQQLVRCGEALRVVLEHEQGVEQLPVSGEGVHLGEPDVLVGKQLGLLVLHPAQQVPDRLRRAQPHPDRHRVDEQAHHGLDPG